MSHNFLLRILILSLALLFGVPASAGTPISLAEYLEQLHDFSNRTDALAAHPKDIASIPDEIIVRVNNRETTVNYRDLKNDLSALGRANAEERTTKLRRIQNYLQALSAEAESYDQSPDFDAAHKKLADILARREFRHVGGPSAQDLLLSKLFAWLSRILSKLVFRGAPVDWVTILIHFVIAVSMLLLVIWTVRRFRRRVDEPASREIIPFSPSARGWRAWLDEARRMAQQEDWGDAIHLAYWAGISFLESGGAWKPDRARTPREYLRLLGARKPEYASLVALTRKFEVVWYGGRAASSMDFEETLGQLEKLGCR